MTLWWGEPWPADWRENGRAPICEDDMAHMATPVGEPCLWCEERITDGDQGVMMSYYNGKSSGLKALHIECEMRSVLGGPAHFQKLCICCGGNEEDPDLGMTRRAAAQWVWKHITQEEA